MQETKKTQAQSLLGQEDPLEEGMATHSSIHAWRIPWIKKNHAPNMSLSTSLEPSIQGWAGSWGTRESPKPRKGET